MAPVTTTYHRIWFTLIALALAVEGVALWRKGDGDTLSEWTWSKIRTVPMRILVGAFLVWIFYHFLIAGPKRGLTRLDAATALLGGLAGAVAFRWGWH